MRYNLFAIACIHNICECGHRIQAKSCYQGGEDGPCGSADK